MALFLLLAIIGIPILEIIVLLKVGGLIGVVPTVALVLLTAAIGTMLLRAQGLSTLNRARENLNHGELPMREVFDGACLLVGGALLLTPGFITDTMGFLLLLPPVRSALLTMLKRNSTVQMHVSGLGTNPGSADPWPGTGTPGSNPRRPQDSGPGIVIDGDYEEVDPDKIGPARPTRWNNGQPSDDSRSHDS